MAEVTYCVALPFLAADDGVAAAKGPTTRVFLAQLGSSAG